MQDLWTKSDRGHIPQTEILQIAFKEKNMKHCITADSRHFRDGSWVQCGMENTWTGWETASACQKPMNQVIRISHFISGRCCPPLWGEWRGGKGETATFWLSELLLRGCAEWVTDLISLMLTIIPHSKHLSTMERWENLTDCQFPAFSGEPRRFLCKRGNGYVFSRVSLPPRFHSSGTSPWPLHSMDDESRLWRIVGSSGG